MPGLVRSRILDRSTRRTATDPPDAPVSPDKAGRDAVAPGRAPVPPSTAARRWPVVPVELAVLAFLAAVTRLAWITHPNAIVFDEVYFREYALRYLDGMYYFDLHPPLGKLLLGGWAGLTGISATADSTDPAVALRVLPALAGVALILVFYQFLRELTASRKVATLGAALLLLDNAILVESRLILINSMLLLFGVGAITCYLTSRRCIGRAHWILLTSSALLAGMAASTKWTGLAAIGLIGLLWLFQTLRNRVDWRRALPQAVVLLVGSALLYVGVFAVHFALLPNSGPGDAYMSARFQSTLVGNAGYDPAVSMSVPEQLVEINTVIPSYEVSLNDSEHPYSSTWLTWPIMKRGIYYWNDASATDGTQQYIYLLGNPVIWWGVLVGIVVVALAWIRRPELYARHVGVFALLGVAWAANYLPFSTIERPMFLYHYFFSFLFAIAAVSIGLGLLAGWMTDGERPWQFPSRPSTALYVGILVVALAGFLWFAPISYGLPLTDGGLADRMWLDTWR